MSKENKDNLNEEKAIPDAKEERSTHKETTMTIVSRPTELKLFIEIGHRQWHPGELQWYETNTPSGLVTIKRQWHPGGLDWSETTKEFEREIRGEAAEEEANQPTSFLETVFRQWHPGGIRVVGDNYKEWISEVLSEE